MENNCLPKGWTRAAIPDLLVKDGIFIDGDWVETKDQDPDGDVRLVQLADVGDGIYRDRSNRFLTKSKAQKLNCTFLELGDVLIARMPDPLGRACIFPGDKKPSVTVVDVCIVRPGTGSVNGRWLMYAVDSPEFRASISSLQSGSTRKRISRGNLAKLQLPLPPLPEQHRIVAKIEELFSDLDAGVEALKKVKAELKRYRQAVLKAAVEGKLTDELRRKQPADYESAGRLLERIRAERAKNGKAKLLSPIDKSGLPELPEGWEWTTLDSLSSNIGDADHKMPKALKEGIPYVSTRDFYGRDYIDFEGAKRVSEEDYTYLSRKVKPEPGDLLLSRYGTVGEVRKISTSREFLASYSIATIKPVLHEMTDYIVGAIRSEVVQTQIKQAVRATAQPDLGLAYIRHLMIPLAPLTEQRQIVSEVERRLTAADQVGKTVEASLKQAERLRQSILKRAFEGKLVAQDPSDEPAEKLLERIKQERANKNSFGKLMSGS